MQIEEGKYYKDRKGREWGPMEYVPNGGVNGEHGPNFTCKDGYWWVHDGRLWDHNDPLFSCFRNSSRDLIEEVAGPLPQGGSSVSVKAPTCALGLLLDIQQAAHERGYEIEAFTYGEGNITLNLKEKAHA